MYFHVDQGCPTSELPGTTYQGGGMHQPHCRCSPSPNAAPMQALTTTVMGTPSQQHAIPFYCNTSLHKCDAHMHAAPIFLLHPIRPWTHPQHPVLLHCLRGQRQEGAVEESGGTWSNGGSGCGVRAWGPYINPSWAANWTALIWTM